MLSPYRKVLATPGAVAFSTAGAIARLPLSMATISIVLLVEAVYGSYELAGVVSAVYTLATAICGPQLAKLIDAHGQARVMRPALSIATVALLGLAITAVAVGPVWALFPTAAVAGATIGSMGALTRARWSALVSDPRQLHTAFAVESAVDEMVFVVGPILATTLATAVSPAAGLVVAVAAAASGGFWFLSQRSTEPVPSGRRDASDRRSVVRSPGMVVLVVIFVAAGTMFGSIDVATVAFAEQSGSPGMAGVNLGVLACGSLIGGLLYGAREFTMPTWKRFVIGLTLLAAGISMFILAQTLLVLAGVMFVAGFGLAPTIINGNALVQQMVPPARLTEGLTWLSTAIGVGVAVGSALGGRVIDAHGGHAGYLVTVGAAGCAAVLALVSARRLKMVTSPLSSPLPPASS